MEERFNFTVSRHRLRIESLKNAGEVKVPTGKFIRVAGN